MTDIKHPNTIDLTNKKYGKLTVLGQSAIRGNKNQIKWDCICECGNSHTTTGECLRSGKTKSCGCLRNQEPLNKIQDRTLAIWKYLYASTILKRNKKRGVDGDISLEDFILYSQKPCHYCGLENSNFAKDRRGGSKYHKSKYTSNTIIEFNGLDRLDSSKGYLSTNVVSCCKYCNTAKNIMSVEDFMKFIKRVYDHNF